MVLGIRVSGFSWVLHGSSHVIQQQKLYFKDIVLKFQIKEGSCGPCFSFSDRMGAKGASGDREYSIREILGRLESRKQFVR